MHSLSAERVVSGLEGCLHLGLFLTFLTQPAQLDGTEIEINIDNQCEWEKESYKGRQITAVTTNLFNADQQPV